MPGCGLTFPQQAGSALRSFYQRHLPNPNPENHFSFAFGTLQQAFSIFAVKAKANQRPAL